MYSTRIPGWGPAIPASSTQPQNQREYRALAKIIVGSVISLVAALALMTTAHATPATEYQHNLDQRAALQDQIAANSDVIAGIEVERSALQQEYDDLQAEVLVYQSEVDALDDEIDALQEQIDIANQELDDKYEIYCRRIREIEEYGTTSYWAIVFQATDLADLLSRLDYVEEIISYDENALNEIEAGVVALDAQAEELSSLRADRNYSAQRLKQAQNQLYAKIQQRLNEIKGYEAENAAINEEVQRLTLEGMELLDRINGKDYNGTMDPAEIYQKYVVNTGEAARNPLGSQIVAFTLQYNGGEYVWGGASPEVGFDCSGMMYYVYAQFGYSICRTASMQYKYNGQDVSFDNLQSGDMVFFHPPGEGNVSHVGMYIGDGLFIHAASRKSGIKVSSLYSDYYSANYLGARRII